MSADISQMRPSWQTNPVPVPQPDETAPDAPEEGEPETQWLDMQE